jgi:hypothetical protein
MWSQVNLAMARSPCFVAVLSSLKRLDDSRVVQYAEELFDGLMIVRPARS